jgi:protein-S-isoprenylcysteine O-methyltransferase Ste14
LIPFIERWIATFWLVLWIVWWLAAFISKPSVKRQNSGSRLLQSGLFLLGLALLFNIGRFITRGWLAARIVPHTDGFILAGAALTLAGVLFTFWARTILGRNWSGRVTIKQDHELILRGPYALVRHPIYTGLLVGLLGTAIVYGYARGFVGVLITGIGLWLKLQTEEQFMVQQFGDQYAHYRQRVRALVPFVL